MTEGAAGRMPGAHAGLFGKLRHKRDFVRVNHDFAAALAFDRWLGKNIAQLASRKAPLPRSRIAFLFAQPNVSLVGWMAPSRDRVGRAFPLCVYAPVATSALSQRPAAAWLASGGFLEQAAALVAALDALSFDDIVSRVATLSAPSQAAFETAIERVEASLDATPAASLSAACSSSFVASLRPSAAELLFAPAAESTHVVFWLELATRLLDTPSGPAVSVFWDQEGRQLVMCRGAPPAHVLHVVVSPVAANRALADRRGQPSENAAELESKLAQLAPSATATQLLALLAP